MCHRGLRRLVRLIFTRWTDVMFLLLEFALKSLIDGDLVC
jgi:hypothetical protein